MRMGEFILGSLARRDSPPFQDFPKKGGMGLGEMAFSSMSQRLDPLAAQPNP
jgi:hypothetical protein